MRFFGSAALAQNDEFKLIFEDYIPISWDEIVNGEKLFGRLALRAGGERTRATRAPQTAIETNTRMGFVPKL
jgi:hypothetical protein